MLAFTRAVGEGENGKHRHELWIANLHGTPEPRRLYGEPNVPLLDPRDWSPDGRSIAVLLEFEDSVDRLALVSVDDGANEMTVVTAPSASVPYRAMPKATPLIDSSAPTSPGK